MENSVKFLFSGDSALVIEFGNEISVDINKKIRKMMDNIKKENIDKNIVSDIISIIHLTRMWVSEKGILGENNLLTNEQTK